MKKNSLLAAIVLLAAILAIVFYLQPMIAHDSSLALEIDQKQEELRTAEIDFNKASNEKKIFNSLSDLEKKKLISQIPETLEQQSLIDNFDIIAGNNNANIASITFSNLPDKNGLKRVSMLVNFVSTSEKNPFFDIIKAVEENDRLYTITSVSFLLHNAQSNLSLTIEAYYKK